MLLFKNLFSELRNFKRNHRSRSSSSSNFVRGSELTDHVNGKFLLEIEVEYKASGRTSVKFEIWTQHLYIIIKLNFSITARGSKRYVQLVKRDLFACALRQKIIEFH